MECSPEKKLNQETSILGGRAWLSINARWYKVIKTCIAYYRNINATHILYLCVDVLVYQTMYIFIRLASISHYKQIMNQSQV